MMIGFIVLSHQNPAQLARLVATLNALYGDPPIACHHDDSQSALDRGRFPANVMFVAPSLQTGWGKWNVVEGALAALRLLYDAADPDWFVLMSATDYPIAPAARVRADLAASGADALIDHREAGMDAAAARERFGPGNPALDHFESAGNRAMLPRRYMGAELWLPALRMTGPHAPRIGRRTIALPFDTPRHPFTDRYRCCYGDHWFSGARTAAAALLSPSADDLKLRRHLRRRASADECYYQSVLCNRPELALARDSRRYARWNGGGAHPATLGIADVDAMLSSSAHFARKFRHDDPALDRIDAALTGGDAGRW